MRVRIEVAKWGVNRTRHAYDPSITANYVTNNMIESFNHWVGDLRVKLPLNVRGNSNEDYGKTK